MDQRLLLAGYRPAELVLGRLAFQALALTIAAAYSVLLVARSSATAGLGAAYRRRAPALPVGSKVAGARIGGPTVIW